MQSVAQAAVPSAPAAAPTEPVARLGDPCPEEASALAVVVERVARARAARPALDDAALAATAQRWIEAVRARPEGWFALERLLAEFPISGDEGRALMRLAEALLRVPDADTALRLTADQLGRGAWRAHVGSDRSLLANLSGSALWMTERLLAAVATHAIEPLQLGVLQRLGAPAVLAATQRTIQLLGRQFVLGETIDAALRRAADAPAAAVPRTWSFDMLGEGARSADDAHHYLAAYRDAIARIAAACPAADPRGAHRVATRPSISVKLSALHPRFETLQRPHVLEVLLPRLVDLLAQARAGDVGLTIDAEESERLELSLELFEALLATPAAAGWGGLGLAVQAYQRRAVAVIERVHTLAASAGTVVPVRLVKGAYWDGEVKRAQELGLPSFPVWTRKSHTDLAYLACAFALLDARPHLWPQFATHNANTIATLLAAAGPADGSFELQRLHGMGEALHREVAATTAVGTRVYAPVGSHRDLLAYLVRRLLENGANSSFVNRLADPDEPAAALVEPPCVLLARAAAPPDASEPQVTEPAALVAGMTGRRHAAGLDAQQPAHLATLRAGLAAWRTATWHATPLLATPTQGDDLGAARVIENPARRDDRVGTCVDASEAVGARAAQAAHAAFRRWEATPARTRAAILRSAADAFEAHRDELHALVMREAGRTLVDAIAELREAVDFLRFYADEAERLFASPQPLPGPTGESNALWLRGRGPWLAVSPWNFPLAIFTGQVAAALAAGNTVLAKPAEQTPLVAWRATQLLHAAGVPRDALQLLPGPGDTLGAALVRDTRVAGVVFTGSTEVARRIQRALAERPGAIVPLIAETGGINAMVVDSTALPQQVTDAVIASAFRSAGQRCSALRLLCVQADIADVCLAMLDGALRELRVGDPWDLATDVGPLIDADAVDRVRAHVAQLERDGRVRARAPLADRVAAHGHYVAPVVAEIPAVDALRDEVFGPCLHVVRWPADGLEALLDAIDATGYGLTFGLHSRIDARADAVAAQVRAGNVYVNRNIIGANVGMQPFGGEGLSGTGPKAGGPHYLVRFAVERTITVNTAAAGGNVALLAGTATRGT